MCDKPNVHFKDPVTGEEYIGIPEDNWLEVILMLSVFATLSPLIFAIPFLIFPWGK